MSWRGVLTLVLLVAAVVTGWSVWRQHERAPEAAGSGTRSEYVLHDFELVALDDAGVESFTLRSPEMSQTPGQRSMDMASPVFLLPDSENSHSPLSTMCLATSAKRGSSDGQGSRRPRPAPRTSSARIQNSQVSREARVCHIAWIVEPTHGRLRTRPTMGRL